MHISMPHASDVQVQTAISFFSPFLMKISLATAALFDTNSSAIVMIVACRKLLMAALNLVVQPRIDCA